MYPKFPVPRERDEADQRVSDGAEGVHPQQGPLRRQPRQVLPRPLPPVQTDPAPQGRLRGRVQEALQGDDAVDKDNMTT